MSWCAAWLLTLVTAVPAYRWQVVPVDAGGSIECLAASPHDPNLVLAGSDVGGFQRSTDGGHTWRLANQGTRSDADVAVADLAFHPTDRQWVYAATGKCFGRPTGDWGGLLVSRDGGQTWAVRSRAVRFAGHGSARQRGGVLVVDPFLPDTLWAATAWDGVQVSADRGATWTALGLADRFLTGLGRTVDGTLYAAAEPQLGLPGGLYVRPAKATEWVRVYPDPVRGVAVAPSRPGQVLIATPDAGLLLSQDAGAHWVNVTPAGFQERLIADTVLFSPTHPEVGLATGLERHWQRRHPDVYVTLDGGRTWRPMTSQQRADVDVAGWWAGADRFGFHPHCAAFDPRSPRRLWIGDWYNIWATQDGAASWFSGHRGLRTAVVRHLALDPLDPNVAWLGLADIGAFRASVRPLAADPLGGNSVAIGSVTGLAARREPGGTAVYLSRGRGLWRQERVGVWSARPGQAPGNLGRLLALPDGSMLAEVEGFPLHVSYDRGESWVAWGAPPRVDGRPVRVALPVLLDEAGRLAVARGGEHGLFLTRNAGVSWEAISADLPDVDHGGQRHKHLTAVAGQPGPQPVLYAATVLAVWRSTDLGTSWSRILPRSARCLAVDRRSGRLYVGPSGAWYTRDEPDLLASDDQGATFEVIRGAWPAHRQYNLLVPDPRVPGRLWVGLEGNVAVVGEEAASGG